MEMEIQIQPIREGRRNNSDGFDPSSLLWAVFDLKDVQGFVKHYWGYTIEQFKDRDWSDLAEDLTGWSYDYNGPGRWFWSHPSIRVSKTKVLVKQHGAYDI